MYALVIIEFGIGSDANIALGALSFKVLNSIPICTLFNNLPIHTHV